MFTDQEDHEEKKVVQDSRTDFKKKGNQQLTEDRRSEEITVDLVWQTRTKIDGPEDTIVNEMIKTLSSEKICTFERWVQERFMGLVESPTSWKIVKLVFLRKAGR